MFVIKIQNSRLTQFMRQRQGTGIVLDPLYYDDENDDTITMASGLKFMANKGPMLNEGLTLCVAPSQDLAERPHRKAGDASLLNVTNSLWQRLWQTAVRTCFHSIFICVRVVQPCTE